MELNCSNMEDDQARRTIIETERRAKCFVGDSLADEKSRVLNDLVDAAMMLRGHLIQPVGLPAQKRLLQIANAALIGAGVPVGKLAFGEIEQ